jgi:hypothetical protein
MVSIGYKDITLYGHGFFSSQLEKIPFLALPLDPDTLPSLRYEGVDRLFRRVPSSALLDLAVLVQDVSTAQYPLCPRLVHEELDRLHLVMPDDYDNLDPSAPHRRVLTMLTVTPMLQLTHTSAQDLVMAKRTPSLVP